MAEKMDFEEEREMRRKRAEEAHDCWSCPFWNENMDGEMQCDAGFRDKCW